MEKQVKLTNLQVSQEDRSVQISKLYLEIRHKRVKDTDLRMRDIEQMKQQRLQVRDLLKPEEIIILPEPVGPPAFMAPSDWATVICATIIEEMEQIDWERCIPRCPPMLLT
jgi:hypothetical protein